MSNSVKRILSIVLLMVFLLPSTGMLIYVHRCNMSNTTLVDIEAQKPCCAEKAENEITEASHSCQIPLHSDIDHQTVFSALPCCDDAQIFVKLGLHLLGQSVKVLHADFPFIINNFNIHPSLLDNNPEIRIADNLNNFPPGYQTFIKHSSLRL